MPGIHSLLIRGSVALAALLALTACSGDRSPTSPAAAAGLASNVTGGWSGTLQLSPTFSRQIMLILTQGANGQVTGSFEQVVGRLAVAPISGHYDGISHFVGSVGPDSVTFTVSQDGHTAHGLDEGLSFMIKR